MARSVIFACNMPLYFWGDAVEYATYILNRISTSANDKRDSPYEVLTKVVPDLRDSVVIEIDVPRATVPGQERAGAAVCSR